MLFKLFATLPTPISPPRLRDRIKLKGIKNRTTVHFDSGGVPHVIARSVYDLFFAQGYLCARDRMWQIDYLRRLANGSLAEIFGDVPPAETDFSFFQGKSYVDLDFFMRCFGLRRGAARSLARLSTEAFDALSAYSDGVNSAFLEEPTQPEFFILRYTPQPWVPLDSLLILRVLAFQLNTSFRAILLNQLIAEKFAGRTSARVLSPSFINPKCVTTLFSTDEELPTKELLELDNWQRFFSACEGLHLGSNAWVVSGEMTATGKPYLCNDLHMPLSAPSQWYAMHLYGGGYDTAGITIPGVPGVLAGHNRYISWGVTSAKTHDADVFIEELDPEKPDHYFVQEKSVLFQLYPQRIMVKGAVKPVERMVRTSKNGPIISDAVGKSDNRFVHSLKWVGHEGTRELDAMLAINRARDFGEFREGCKLHSVPGFNFVYADINGNIGYQLAAQLPVRKKGPNLSPVPARYEEHGWGNDIPFEHLPTLYNPQCGFIASANNKVVDENYPYYLSEFWEPYHRFQRLVLLLSGRKNLTLDDMINIQNDQFSGWAKKIIEVTIKPWLNSGGTKDNIDLEVAAEELITWDGVERTISNASAIFHLFYHELIKKVLKRNFDDELFNSYLELFSETIMPLESIISSSDSDWFERIDRTRLIREALSSTLSQLTLRFGPKMEEWKWGKLHTMTINHPMHSAPIIDKLYTIGPFETGGDGTTLSMGYYDPRKLFVNSVGVTARMIHDLGNWDNTLLVLNTGQSGHPLSQRYKDHAEKMVKGEYYRLPFGMGTIELYPKMVLEPAK